MNPVAPLPNPDYQLHQDAEHLRLLTIFYYVVAGLLALSGLIFIFHIIMGLAMVNGSFGPPSGSITITPNTFPSAPSLPPGASIRGAPGGPPPAFGWMFVIMGTGALLAFETLAGFTFYAGRCLANRTKKMLIQVVAAILCLNVPFGTALGVFTFIVLSRPTVAALFNTRQSS